MVRYLIELGFYFFCTLPRIIWGKLHGNLVRVHWGRHLNNFGDCLTPDILKYYGMTPAYISSNEEADIILAGTILQWVKPSFNVILLEPEAIVEKFRHFLMQRLKL